VNAVALTDNPVLDGTSTSGQVTISGPAASGGQIVDLQSSDPRVTVPGSVVVTATQTTASFAVNTSVGPTGHVDVDRIDRNQQRQYSAQRR